MTVKEVFELRRQGRIEEAYEAIRPMYAVHQGKYTTLCMFWTASDILRKRIAEKRIAEAESIFKALLRVQPNVDDDEGKVQTVMMHHALRLSEESASFRILEFVESLPVEALTDEDWQGGVSQDGKHPLPSTAQRLLTRSFHVIQEQMYGDFMSKKAPLPYDEVVSSCLKVMPLLQEAMRRSPRDKHNQRYMAVVYTIMGEREKADAIYRQLLRRYHDSYLYAELAELTDEPGQKAALYCMAIQNQRQEKFRCGYRLALARLLLGRDKSRAAYELQKCVETRKALGYHITSDIEQMLRQLAGVQAATDAEQQDFYVRMAAKYPITT
ncbi:MAG: acetyltransferase [Bacteroidaceae bacterium]|nr:acetyltransferase [Bacteroidaceae bacterium]